MSCVVGLQAAQASNAPDSAALIKNEHKELADFNTGLEELALLTLQATSMMTTLHRTLR